MAEDKINQHKDSHAPKTKRGTYRERLEYKIVKMKKICFHYTLNSQAEYYDEIFTTKSCLTNEKAGDIVCNYFHLTTLNRKLARIISIENGGKFVA